ncbi:MAG TPA: carbonic anhydrase, partial [Polyangiales bacterium]|nr:carbonic anhydrase [Polyangiales bacterium]
KAGEEAATKKLKAKSQAEEDAAAKKSDEVVAVPGELLTAVGERGFALPFAWEKSPEEPLAKARKYLREIADDNVAYMARGPEFFHAFAAGQHPRATVVSCADSRVQAGAFDATSENDDYTVRNVGNQIENSLGSIQYGIEQQHTPVLLILGHTGCDAIKAGMGDTTDLPAALKQELATLHVEKHGKKAVDDRAWLAAVVENIHEQVKISLREFGPRVNAGELTIVGAIYDFRNDLGKGAGRLAVINVNGIRDPVRLKSFVDAIMSGPSSYNGDDPMARLARALADPGPANENSSDDE